MRVSRFRPRIAGSVCIVAVGCLLAAGIGDALAQVTGLRLGKGRGHYQTNAGGLGNNTPCGLYCGQLNGTVYGAASAPVLTRPGGAPLSYTNSGPGVWHIAENSNSPAQLEARYPNGAYSVTADGTSYSLSLNGDAYPNAPVFTLGGGAWVDGKYVIDPRQPFSVAINAFTGYGTHPNDSFQVFIGREGANVFDRWAYHHLSPTAPTSFTIPAGTLEAGREYYIGAGFYRVVDYTAGPPTREGYYAAYTSMTVKAETQPLFPMSVSASITPTVSNATATFQPRPQDVGQAASVYAFAVAPSNLVANAPVAKAQGPTWKAKGAKADTPVQCVLAQLNASGQLQAVSASALTAYVSGVLTAQGQSVNLLNNVATPNIAGAAFYLGYGASAQQMIASGVNQRALSVPGSISCDPKPPQTGWWYNASEGGRGFSIEARGNRLFMAAFHYDASGRATWNFAGGATSVDGSLFTAEFLGASGGQTMTGPYRAPGLGSAGPITLAFSDASHGTLAWPGGTVAIERQPFVPNGLSAAPQAGVPESGWWWNPQESGRGFFIEWQNGYADLAGYMYDEAGNPTWYITVVPTPNPMAITGNWWTFAGGQSMGGPYRPATRTSDNAGAVAIEFATPTTATMTLPDGRRIPLVRQAF